MSTSQSILEAAEELFAAKGYHATSIRDITRKAQVNLAAIHYHFHSKQGLLMATLQRHLAPINQERLRRLRSVPLHELHLEHVLRSFLAPAFHAIALEEERGARLLRLIGRIHSELGPEFLQGITELMRDTVQVFQQAFAQVLPEGEPAELLLRLHFTIGAMAHSLHLLSGHMPFCPAPQNLDHLLDSLVDFAMSGFSGQPSAPVKS